ncbi:methyltransferase [Actinopolymorpha alba]|uniref:methyltransferase n=1 Tax=Actinopolymorpha alba TaxID=533267 RepID=UPI00037EE764|nr:class I SAM-dependent methyltransferase [Actinopolymorpha alba]
MSWVEAGTNRSARWISVHQTRPPSRVTVVDDQLRATTAYALVRRGKALLWRGDFHNARQLQNALARRIDRTNRTPPSDVSAAELFHAYRRERRRRARLLNLLLVPLDGDHSVPLRRAPEVRQACAEVYGPPKGPAVLPLRELLGVIGAYEWRRTGIRVPALGGRIHPHHGVFSPVRGEYVDLVARAPLPGRALAFDIGTGTGVLAGVLARRGVARIIATDMNPAALSCATDNLARLGYADRAEVVRADLFPSGRASLVVCNPPWIPATPSTPLDQAVYDPEGRMLRGFLHGLAEHLEPGGEGWLVLSDLAEHLRLRSRAKFLATVQHAGLTVVGTLDTRPAHRRIRPVNDPLGAARAAEVITLWRLAALRE